MKITINNNTVILLSKAIIVFLNNNFKFLFLKYFLHLVKTFLTSIKFTFDNLSRKIKNPCLVINKNSFFKEEIIMHNFKKLFTYMVVGALVMALSISCKSNEEPKDNTHSNHPPSGTYKGTVGSITTTAIVTTSGALVILKGLLIRTVIRAV